MLKFLNNIVHPNKPKLMYVPQFDFLTSKKSKTNKEKKTRDQPHASGCLCSGKVQWFRL
jgi:hypothetical protein